jgi:predicted transcriptional regulator
MSIAVTTIKGTGIICKGSVKGNFELVPMELFDYIQLGLITHTDLVVYVKLLQLYNHKKGYAYPTIPHLMLYAGIGSKVTVHRSLNTLEEVGLIQKGKTNRGNNIYVVYKPLSKTELYKLVPDKVQQLKKNEEKLIKMNEYDKERFQQHQQTRQEQVEQQIPDKHSVPRGEQSVNNESIVINNDDLLPEEIEMHRKAEILAKR